MHCPVCKDSTLVMTERQGIEIDYCPQCRGVWLDRGELDKIIQRSLGSMADSAAPAAQPAMQQPVQPAFQPAQNGMQPPVPPQYPPQYPPQHGHGQYPNQHQHDPRYHKRKKSFWEDLFD